MSLSATGLAVSTGDAQVTTITPAALTASGSAVSSGSAAVTTTLPLGAFTDFGVWPAALPDPAISCVQAVSAPDSTGRTYLSATIPTAYATALGTLWNAAASAAVTATFQHASGNTLAVTDVQIEHGPPTNLLPGDAADYRSQMLYLQGSSTTGGVTTYDAAVERVAGQALTGAWCAQLTNNGGLSPYSMSPMPAGLAPVVAGQTYIATVNIALQRANAVWNAQLMWYDVNFNLLSTTAGSAQNHPGGGVYQPIRVRGTAPTSAVWAAIIPVITPAAVGDGEVCYVDAHRIWSLQPSGTSAPNPFQPARQQNITLRANRVNYAQNPSFGANLYGWWSSVGTTSNPGTWDPTVGRSNLGSLKMAVAYATGAYPKVGTYTSGVGSIAPGQSGQTFTFSVYVQPVSGCPTIRLLATTGGETPSGTVVYGTTTAQVEPDAAGWYRLSVTATIPEATSGALGIILYVSQSDWDANAGPVDFWVDDLLVEQSPLVGAYFDAAATSPDYLWEGTPFQSRSHYYENLRFLQYRLGSLLQDALPVGVPYQLLFAQPD